MSDMHGPISAVVGIGPRMADGHTSNLGGFIMVKAAISLAIAFAVILCMVINAWIMPHPSSYDAPRNSPSPMVDLDGDDIRESDDWHGLRVEEDSPLWDCRTMGNLTCGDTYYGD